MSLRGRLLALLLALVVVGLVVADVATYAVLNRFLIRRIDQQLEATWRPVELAIQFPERFPNPADGPGGRAEVDVQLRNPAGVVIGSYRSRRSSETSKPAIPRKLPSTTPDPVPRAGGDFFNSPTTAPGDDRPRDDRARGRRGHARDSAFFILGHDRSPPGHDRSPGVDPHDGPGGRPRAATAPCAPSVLPATARRGGCASPPSRTATPLSSPSRCATWPPRCMTCAGSSWR